MKKKVHYFALDKRDTTSFFRMHGVLPFIEHKGFELTPISEQKTFDWTSFVGVSTLLFQRPFGKEHAQVITAAKNNGVKVIVEYDDDLTCVDMYNPTHELYKANQYNLETCLQLADEVWVSTESIKQSYLAFNKNIYAIPNAHNDFIFPVKDKRPFTYNKTVYWRGGASHAADVAEKSALLIDTINANTDWTFMFHGDRFTNIEIATGDNHQIIPPMTILEFFRYLNDTNPSIMIFPLRDTKFNRGKSNISFLESSYAGAAFAGNIRLPEFSIPGISDVNNLAEIIKCDSDILSHANKTSWEYILDTLLLSNINQLRVNRILENL